MSDESGRSLTPGHRAILEEAASEAKRINRDEADGICLALVLAKRQAESFEETFGQGSAKRLKALAFNSPAVGGREDVTRFLLGCQDEDESICQLLNDEFPGLGWALAEGTSESEQIKSLTEMPGTFSGASSNQSNLQELDPKGLTSNLKERIKGQDEAIEAVVRRLALTRAEFDLRPHRPDGVFMFVGPTGVGKTELAKALAVELMGDENAMIRLDMSEYAGDWAVSRLTGPMPGYSGSDKPDSWLTTRVIANPHSVILLDEIEKASPVVWNTFLQAFDDGRLTDSRGEIADFSKTIIVMTSNLGAEVFTRNPVGFQVEADDPDSREQREEDGLSGSLRKALPIELFNRIDSVITFRALDVTDIEAIANQEIDRVIGRLQARNLDLRIEDEARRLLARRGYDRQLGARHLHRNIEGLLLEPLALQGIKAGRIDAYASDESIRFRGASPD